MTVETHWSDIRLGAADWAEAFEAAQSGTPHNEARDQIWEQLLAILVDKLAVPMDKQDGDVPEHLLRKSLLRSRDLRAALNRAWPLIEPADLVADLWSVPAYLRMCAPWLSPQEVQKLQRRDAQAWTVSDLPLLSWRHGTWRSASSRALWTGATSVRKVHNLLSRTVAPKNSSLCAPWVSPAAPPLHPGCGQS
jgi:hypothetical protein